MMTRAAPSRRCESTGLCLGFGRNLGVCSGTYPFLDSDRLLEDLGLRAADIGLLAPLLFGVVPFNLLLSTADGVARFDSPDSLRNGNFRVNDRVRSVKDTLRDSGLPGRDVSKGTSGWFKLDPPFPAVLWLAGSPTVDSKSSDDFP